MATTNNVYAALSASDLTAIILQAAKHPVNMDRDAGFFSGSSENGDDYNQRDGDPRSPTDASEDSIEVKLTPITIPKNKRKSHEPARLILDSDFPLKKRIRFEDKLLISPIKSETTEAISFRPWAAVSSAATSNEFSRMSNPAEDLARHPGVTTLHRVPSHFTIPTATTSHEVQDQPLALLKKRAASPALDSEASSPCDEAITTNPSQSAYSFEPSQAVDTTNFSEQPHHSNAPGNNTNSYDSFGSTAGDAIKSMVSDGQQRNYKNMTRERRIEANARERTRVHTISAAFDTLRKAIPSYSQSQKLSKLSVLRVACSYILTLSRIAGDDYSPDQSEPSINECADEVSRTIQTEGKIRKKKDE